MDYRQAWALQRQRVNQTPYGWEFGLSRLFLNIFHIFRHRHRVCTIVMLMQISISCFKLLLYSLLLTVLKRLDAIALPQKSNDAYNGCYGHFVCDIMCIRFAVHPFSGHSFSLLLSLTRLLSEGKRWKYLGIIYIILSLLRLGFFLLIYQRKNFELTRVK